MSEIYRKLLSVFQAEHAEHLGQIRSLLALAEQAGGVPNPLELDEIFRRAHTLKGAARAVELKPVEEVAHGLETLFSRVREGVIGFDRKVSGVIRQALDSSEDYVAAIAANRRADTGGAVEAIGRLLCLDAPAGPPAAPLAPLAGQTPGTAAAAPPLRLERTVRLDREALDRFDRTLWRLTAEIASLTGVAGDCAEVDRQVRDMERESDRVRSSIKAWGRSGGEGLTQVIRYADFMERALGNLVPQSRKARKVQRQTAWALESTCQRLQMDLQAARMVPAESVFEGFYKMTRDLARGVGKEIEFRIAGGSLLADRMVLQALRDPVMHLLRNAIDHGVENPADRVAKGKPRAGSVVLRISSERCRLRIALEDDGRGIDLEKIRAAAVRRGVLSAAELAGHSSPDVARLIFEPGFSTAPAVTDLSGRGMGLSVVYEAMRRLQGEVDLDQTVQTGASLILSVPLSAASSRLLLVKCGAGVFAVPMHGIASVFRVRRNTLDTAQGRPLISFEGRKTPLFSLAGVLGLEAAQTPGEDAAFVMVLQSGARRAAVRVDEFLSEREGLIQDLGVPFGISNKIAGATLLPGGAIVIVLNPPGLVEACAHAAARSVQGPGAPAPAAVPQILVADDSMTTRLFEKSILEAAGYRVRLAVDGVEALASIRATPPDLVVTDLEMPRMGGFGLIQAMKADKNLSGIPVIIVSSVEKVKDRARGLELGAGAYIAKRKFDSVELLAAVRQIL